MEWKTGKYPEKNTNRCKICTNGMHESRVGRKVRKILSQDTAIDEYIRIRYTWFTNEHNTYMSSEFVKRAVKYFPLKIDTVQTDNGFEFTNRLSWQCFLKNKETLFEKN